jgi:sulfide:quinone oxidoreductase
MTPPASHSVRSPRPRVVIAGGGVAAIEALLALRHLVGDQVSIQLLAPERSFDHRPSSVAKPFGLGAPPRLDLDALARDQRAHLWHTKLTGADPARRVALLAGGEATSYDVLIIAAGAVPKPALPGAISFSGPGQAAEVAALLDKATRGGVRRSQR